MTQVVTLESIMVALETLLKQLTTNNSGFKVVSRRFKTPDQLADGQLPGLYLLQGPITTVRQGGSPPIQTMTVWAFIYTDPAPSDVLPSTTLNKALTDFNAVIAPSPQFPFQDQTLGGLVSRCWIEGETIYDSGEIQPPGMAIVPLRILIPTLAL